MRKAKQTKQQKATYKRKWVEDNRLRFKLIRQQNRAKLKVEVLSEYAGGILQCNCCQEKDVRFLSLDHIHENGGRERHALNKRGYNFYYYLKRSGFPNNGYQVLCHNCNQGKRMYEGKCPHSLPFSDDIIFATSTT